MKVLVVLLLCACVAVQGRIATGQSSKTAASLGDSPWLVHLRYATFSSGLLETGAGSLISSNWVLTSGSLLANVRFIWVRYGVVSVTNPSLVTETTAVRYASDYNDVALINLNRNVESSANIALISLGSSVPASAEYCGFGAASDDVPGETLNCYTFTLTEEYGAYSAYSEETSTTKFDLGAPLVYDGVQVGILVQAGDGDRAGVFVAPSEYFDWIQEETGLELSR